MQIILEFGCRCFQPCINKQDFIFTIKVSYFKTLNHYDRRIRTNEQLNNG